MVPFDKDRRLDIQGRPLYGRVYFYQKDTNQLDKIYVYDENDNLIQCNNPVYTDLNGFLEYDVILDNKIYSIHQESYKGNYTDPKSDSRQIMWEEDRDYYAGLTIEDGKQDTLIYGYESIAEADPELGSITVVGYHTKYDCGARTYVWDATSNDQPDQGQVFRSSIRTNGRWVLVHSLPYIPSEYYGVYPGHLENMSSLFGAPYLYGSDNKIVSPRVIKMKRGTYNIGTNYNTSRTLLIEEQIDFGNTHKINCKDIQISGTIEKKPIGNFKFNGDSVEVHSWIFYDLCQMLESGAKTIHLYDNLSSQNSVKPYDITCKNMTFIGHGCVTYTGDLKYITFDNCHFIGEEILDIGLYVRYKNWQISDRPFKGPYFINWNGVDKDTCSLNIENFRNVTEYVLTVRNLGYKVVDLQGRSYAVDSSTLPTQLLEDDMIYRNGILGNVGLSGNTTFEHCVIDKVSASYCDTANFVDCKIGTLIHSISPTTITLVDSWVANFEHSKKIQCVIGASNTVFNCSIGSDIIQGKTKDESNPYLGSLTLESCEVHGNIVIRGPLAMEKTFVYSNVWTQDYELGSNYVINSTIHDCTIGGRHLLQHYVPYRTGVKSNCSWIGNRFLNVNKNPIYPESWSDPVGEGKFTKDDVTTLYLDPYPENHIWKYSSNVGPKVIPDYPQGSYTGLFGFSSSSYGGSINITEVPFVAPGHSAKGIVDGTLERMENSDLQMKDVKWSIRFYKQLWWTDSHTVKHEHDPIRNTSDVYEFITNKTYGEHSDFVCIPRKATAYYENSSEAYFRICFDVSNDTYHWGDLEWYGTLDIVPCSSVKYVY